MDREENRGCKLFQDSVHGSMTFHKLIVKCIDTREFQRLRNIKQLSTTYLVYPAAAHNRFEHCLGVCWLAGELMNELENNSPKEWNQIFPDEKESKSTKLAIQIAALLHDLGHGPFSHTWENFVKSCGHDWDHEDTSCQLIDLMLYENSKKSELTELGKLFQDEFQNMSEIVEFIKAVIKGGQNDVPKEKAFLFQVVANKYNDIDVDKWDYFLRDAQHLNIGVAFDYRRLMSLCKIEMRQGVSHIAFRDVERYSIQGMFRVRADLHVRAYQHRVAKCLEAMLLDALKAADKGGYQVGGLPLSRVHESPKHFIKLTDSIQEILQNSEDASLKEARQILDRILYRRLYETVYEKVLNCKRAPKKQGEEDDNKPPSGLSKQKLNELEKELQYKCAISQVCVNQGKYYDPMRNVIFYKKDGSSSVSREEDPSMRMDLPFYKVYVFKRVDENCDTAQIRERVGAFLSKEGVL